MSTSLLYHGFGIRGYRYEKTEYVEGGVVFHLMQPKETCLCSACGLAEVVLRGQVERIQLLSVRYPWLVREDAGKVVGYAYAAPHHERAAYRWAVNVSVYIHAAHRQTGIGRKLYTALFNLLRLQGYAHAIAGITLPNEPSVCLHESLGFKLVGIYTQVGYKLGSWRDVGWWQLPLWSKLPEPTEPRSMTEIIALTEFVKALQS